MTAERMALAGRTALVTGASRGAGRAIAERLAQDGAKIAVNYRRDEAAARDVVETIERKGGVAIACRADVANLDESEAMVTRIQQELGEVSILVSNAGVASRGGTVAATPATEFEFLMRVHALGPIALLQQVIPQMRAAGRGDLVVISSSTVGSYPAQAAPYTMAKAAMETAALTVAREERGSGIRANIVSPGLIDTDMGSRLVAAGGTSLEAVAATSPFGRICTPEDVAGTVAFLVSESGSYITGQRITVDGGGPDPDMY